MRLFGRKEKSEKSDPGSTVPVNHPAPKARGDAGLFKRLRQGLTKTRDSIAGRLDRLLLGRKEITGELLEELEEILFTSDIGVATTQKLIDAVQDKVKRKELSDPAKIKASLKEQMQVFLEAPSPERRTPAPGQPLVAMVIGVNGVGKTTTIGKAAHRFRSEGKKVLLVAADTFRAAAVEQLCVWARRAEVDVVRQETGADPSAVVFDALSAAVSRGVDVVLVDTAGRLHTKQSLMDELRKIHRVTGKKLTGAPHEVWLVLDATTGQNAISQARMFHEALGVTDIILTKLDGTAKGGIVVGICHELGLPIRFIGIGEDIEDLRPFDPSDFIEAIFD